MRKLLSLGIVAMLLLSCGKFTEIEWYQGPFASAQVDAGERIIMLDFYTEW